MGENPKLSPEHYAQLREGSGISDEVIEQRGYRTVTEPGELMKLGFERKQTQNVPGLLLPVHCTDGSNGLYTYRPDVPRTFEDKRSKRDMQGNHKWKVIKYEMPKGAAMRLDVPPVCRRQLADAEIPLWITEGQKKADALATKGLCALALLGVWNFKGRNQFGGITWLADWDYINRRDREIRIVFDSDVMTKPEVKAALDRLIEHLQRKGSHVAAVYLPQSDGHKVGVDDYLLLHTLEELEGLIEGPRPKIKCADPLVELLDEEPLMIRRPLSLINGQGYAAIWPNVRVTVTEVVDEQGNVVKFDRPTVVVKKVLCLVRDDGAIFSPEVDGRRLPGTESIEEMDVSVTLPEIPPPDRLWSMPALKNFRAGYRPDPVTVFNQIADVIDRLIDFDRSFADQRTMSETVACFVLSTWFLDSFNVIGYLWPNGERGSGKTQLLMVVARLAHLGLVILSGGSFAALRDLADYGATIAFDDAEPLADPNNKNNEEKRALLLAGNRRGAMVPVKEQQGTDQKWRTRYINNFAPRLFSAIRIPDPILASRTIVVPLVRTSDKRRGNADALDYKLWPHRLEDIVDDCWALSLVHLKELSHYEATVPEAAQLTGRSLEPWRAVLAIAKWLTDRGAEGLFKRLEVVSRNYQRERDDFESEDITRLTVRALILCVEKDRGSLLDFRGENRVRFLGDSEVSPANDDDPQTFLKTKTIVEAIKELVESEDIGLDLEKITDRRIGWVIKRLRLEKHREGMTGKHGWLVTKKQLESYSLSFGLCAAGGVTCETSLNGETSLTTENEDRKRAEIDPQKQARARQIRERVSRARVAAENRYPDRYQWDRSTPEALKASETVDASMGAFEEGNGTLEEVEEAWRAYLFTIDTKKGKVKGKARK
jgi:hypothetical protein